LRETLQPAAAQLYPDGQQTVCDEESGRAAVRGGRIVAERLADAFGLQIGIQWVVAQERIIRSIRRGFSCRDIAAGRPRGLAMACWKSRRAAE